MLKSSSFVAILLAGAVASNSVLAGDSQGRFSVEGVGTATCANFLEALEARGERAHMFGGWVHGYITNENQHLEDTFDVTPWENLTTLTGYLSNHCEQKPEDPFAQAVFSLVAALRADRLQETGPPLQIDVGNSRTLLHRDTLIRAQKRLTELGYYAGPANGDYDEATRVALKELQIAKKLKVTGVPDQLTLHHLLRE